MITKHYVVPEEGLKAAFNAWDHFGGIGVEVRIETVLEAFIRWQSEHPIQPTTEQVDACSENYRLLGSTDVSAIIVEWRRRMYLAKPEAPGSVPVLRTDW